MILPAFGCACWPLPCRATAQAVIKALLDLGADINLGKSENQATPLSIGAQEGHADVVQLLAERNADLNKATTDVGATPLNMAAAYGHTATARVLIEQGAGASRVPPAPPCRCPRVVPAASALRVPLARDARPFPAVFRPASRWPAVFIGGVDDQTRAAGLRCLRVACACRRRQQTSTSRPSRLASTQRLRAVLMCTRSAPRHHACRATLASVFTRPPGCDCWRAGTTPITMAAAFGYVELVALLAASAADLDTVVTDTGTSPLWFAAQEGHVDVVQVLLDASADPDNANDVGCTPLYIASEKGQKEVVRGGRGSPQPCCVARTCPASRPPFPRRALRA